LLGIIDDAGQAIGVIGADTQELWDPARFDIV
jgi:hypothetical protein